MGHIFLYGPPASGKSTVGRILAEKLELKFIDLDDRTEKAAGMDIPQLMKERGEAAFRDIESSEFQRLTSAPDSVVALGGGTLLRSENRTCAEASGQIVCLDAGLQTLLRHLDNDGNGRPLLEGDLSEKLAGLLADRADHYTSFPTRIGVDGREPDEIAWLIQTALGRFYLQNMGAGYKVIVRPDSLASLGHLLRSLDTQNPVVVTDVNVAKLHADSILDSLRRSQYNPHLISIPAGETAKTLDTINDLWRGFLNAGLDRKSTVIALGGGVTGDLAGFADSAQP